MLTNSRTLLGCAILVLSHSVFAQEASKALPKAEIEQIVKQYIMDHPEVILDSVRLMQERQRASQKQKAGDALVARQADLLRDPDSPATRPAASNPADEVSIVEFFDYRCGYCKKVQETVNKLLAERPNVRLVFKEFPILGPESLIAAKAALAAGAQGQYMPFHAALMSAPSVSASSVEQLARQMGLDVARLKTDMESPRVNDMINKNAQLASALGVEATPAFVVGTELVTGAIDAAGFDRLIAQARAARQPKP